MRLHTETVGDGPRRVALVHGLAADGGTWHDLVELALATGWYTLTTVDLRGHGASPRADSYTVRDLADDLVDTLPVGLDDIVSHSLGGAVVAQAVERLRPAHALYLDPGFRVALPTSGVGGWLVKHVPPAMPFFLVINGRGVRKPAVTPENQGRVDAAKARWDRSMAMKVFRDVAFHPRAAGSSAIPSTVVLSEDAPYVVPDPLPAELAAEGWDVRRIAGLGHNLFLEDPQKVWDAVADVL